MPILIHKLVTAWILTAICLGSVELVFGDDFENETPGETAAKGNESFTEAEIAFFESKIRPILINKCYPCHSSNKKSEGELVLDSRSAMREGGSMGPAVVPGDIDESLILSAIRHEDLEMPPEEKLSNEAVADFEKWIEMGAPDPREDATQAVKPAEIDFESARKFWSFQTPVRHPRPKVRNSNWPKQDIDWFVLKQLEDRELAPSGEAERLEIVRRLSYDLVGLPPSRDEVAAFLGDRSSRAYENLVARLLASPHLGERWARMWLDVARFAEDQAHIVGNNKALFYPNAYKYRDWVINSLNDDMPYDQFVKLQLASDLYVGDDVEAETEANQHLAALGFIGLGPKYYRRNDPEVQADEWEDRVDVVGRGLLGLTVACARCHDHKYDPIPTEDYYGLAGVFASTEMVNLPINAEVEINNDGQAKKTEESFHVIRDGKPTDLNVFIRGDVNVKGPVVTRHFLQVLGQEKPIALNDENESGRRSLAESIAHRDNPLTARVFVNRVWAQMFGRGLVDTPSNFGALGSLPSHPQLLDDLAVRFMENNWSVKWLMKEIALSSTYRQSSHATTESVARDPGNQWLSRMNRRRLSVEAWRDTMLSLSGQLSRTIGGPSIDVQDPKATKRTLYSYISRFELSPMLALFDFPDPNVHSAKRANTTTALQKLFVLNDPFMVHHSERLARRILNEQDENQARVELAYATIFNRQPVEAELTLGTQFLKVTEGEASEVLAQYVQVLLASNELLIVD